MKLIYNIETVSICNNSCSYCPYSVHVKGKREGIMTDEVWAKCLYWISKTTQDLVWLHGIGEPLLDPKLFDRIKQLNYVGIDPAFSTNGRLLTPEIAKKLSKLKLRIVAFSPHTPDSISLIEDIMKEGKYHDDEKKGYFSDKYPIPIKVAENFIDYRHNFAGQAEGSYRLLGYECEFVRPEKCSIFSDGRIVTCSIDATGISTIGHILTADFFKLKSCYFSLCDKCHATQV